MNFLKNMTLLKRMVLWFSGITIVILVTLIGITWELRDTIRTNALIRINKILLHQLDAIKMYADERYVTLNNLRQLLYFTSRHYPVFEKEFWITPPEPLEKTLAGFTDKNDFYDVFIITKEGDVVYTAKAESDLNTNLLNGIYRHTELARVFRDALNNTQPYISHYDYYDPSYDFAAFIAEPVVDNGKIIGVVAVQLDNHKMHQVINNYSELGETGKLIATFEHEGKMLTVAPIRDTEIQAFQQMNSLPITSSKAKSGQCYIRDRSGKNIGVAWGYQDDFRMNIAVRIDENELLERWYRQFSLILLLFLVGASVVIGMLIILVRSFSKPIERLTHYAAEISEGHYTLPLEQEHYDAEWQILIKAFQKMSMDINQKMMQLNQQNLFLSNQKKEIETLNANLEERIQIKSEKLQRYIDTVDQYVITSRTDKNGNILDVSEAFCQISGYTKEELMGKNHRIIRHPDMPHELFKDLWETISSGKTWHGEIKNRKSDGGYYWVDTTISPDIEGEKIIGYTAVRHDISDKKIIEELVITDSMTGLYNRRYYAETIKKEMNRVKRHDSDLALMMIDVDNFKLYNDTYGHQAGDTVLIEIAEILRAYTSRSGEYSFRLGGEEFAIVVSGMKEEECFILGNLIRREIENRAIPHIKNKVSPFVTISMGIAFYTSKSEMTCEELYKEADTQLYRAKERGRNQVIIKPSSEPLTLL